MNYCLGRLPHSPERLASSKKHLFGSIYPSPTLDRRNVFFIPGLYENDVAPNCTAVALVNAARAVSSLNGFDLPVNQEHVLNFYASVVGCDPTLSAVSATDGAVITDVLDKQDKSGYDIGSNILVGNWGVIDHTSRNSLALCIQRFGSAYVGVTLYERDMDNIGSLWDIQSGRSDGNVVGGHAVILWDYTALSDTSIVRIGTWGSWQSATWNWVLKRTDEAYGLVWRQLASATTGTFWNNLTSDALLSHLQM